MQHTLPLLFRLSDIRNTGKPQRAALNVVQRKAVQAIELHTINEDFNLSPTATMFTFCIACPPKELLFSWPRENDALFAWRRSHLYPTTYGCDTQ